MMSFTAIDREVMDFLNDLGENNNREWFQENKPRYQLQHKKVKAFFDELFALLNLHDEADGLKLFRIYRDVRFSKNKSPYKKHFAGSFHRVKPAKRGGYYLHLEPGNSFMAAGFWNPEKGDLLRIRKEFELDDEPMRKILRSKAFTERFQGLKGEELKTAPKGFEKDHPAIDLIRKKQFIVTHNFTDQQVLAPDFAAQVNESFKAVRPWFDYMSEVLTTDLNGVSLIGE